MSIADSTTILTLQKSEALVLFALLADYESQPCLEARTTAEKIALVRLQGALENVLVEPFMPDYRSLVDEARSNLEIQAGQEARVGKDSVRHTEVDVEEALARKLSLDQGPAATSTSRYHEAPPCGDLAEPKQFN